MTQTGAGIGHGVVVTEVDGIPAAWADIPGPFAGGLVLRVGHADETLPQHGVTHMLEHLALFGLGRPGEHSNGHVDATTMAMHSVGTPQEVAEFLTRAARQLMDPPTNRLDDEKGVLRVERARQARSMLAELLTWRWGTRAYGLEVAQEYGLPLMTPETVREWAATHVGRRNAALWFTGPPPAGLHLDLPDGVRRDAPDPYVGALPALPAYFRSNSKIVVMHSLVRRSPAAVAACGVLRARLVDDLRTERAAAYSPEVAYRPLSGDVAALVVLSDIVEERAAEVTTRVMATFGELGQEETTATIEELDAHKGTVRTSIQMHARDAAMVTSAAWNLVNGAPVQTAEEVLAELDGLTPESVRAAAWDASRSVLVQVPSGVAVPQPWTPAPLQTTQPVHGGSTHARLGGTAQLRVSADGVSLEEGTSHLTVRYSGLAALAQWDDGGRILIGEDGVHVTVEPTLWRRGRRVIALVDAAVPPGKAVPLGQRDAAAVPRPASPSARAVRHRMTLVGLLLLVLVGVGLAAGTATGSEQTVTLSLLGAAGLLAGAVGQVQRQNRPPRSRS